MISAFALGCSQKAIELSTPPSLQPSSEPSTLASINEQIVRLQVDETRLYWIGIFSTQRAEDGRRGAALHSCLKDQCGSSLVTYDGSTVDSEVAFRARNGEIIWGTVNPGAADGRLVACPVVGCQGLPRVVLERRELYQSRLQLADDGAYVFGRDGALYRANYDNAAPPKLVSQRPMIYLPFAVNGEYLYWVSSDGRGPQVDLKRAPLSEPDREQLIASKLRLTPSSLGQSYTYLGTGPVLEFDGSYVYWADDSLSGSLVRCPLTGCIDGPEVLLAPVRAPRSPLVDGSKMYFQYDDAELGHSLTSCSVEDCMPPAPIAHGLDALGVVAVDDHYVYTATTEASLNPDQPWDFPSAKLRRFPK